MGDRGEINSARWTASFGYWVKRRRLALDLTQAALAHKVGCSTSMIKKIERDERRPSRQIAMRLALSLSIPEDERQRFIETAVGLRSVVSTPLSEEPIFAAGRTPPDWLEQAGKPIQPGDEFVGRERELGWLKSQWGRAIAGEGRVAFVTGEAGRGKTALLKSFVRDALEGSPNLIFASGSCTALTGAGQPYMPFRDILLGLAGDLENLWRQGWISKPQAQSQWEAAAETMALLSVQAPDLVQVLLPDLGSHISPPSDRSSPPGNVATERASNRTLAPGSERLPGQFTDFLLALSQRYPLLLVLDDLQWVDAASLNLIFHLGRRITGGNILILGAFRPSEILTGKIAESGVNSLGPLVDELGLLYSDNILDLGQMDPEYDRRLSNDLVDLQPNDLSETFRLSLFERTKGHPLFTIELLKEMQTRGDLVRGADGRWVEGQAVDWETLPGRTRALIHQRLDRLPPEDRRLLEVASVEGEAFTVELVAGVLDQDELEVHQRLRLALRDRHHLVREAGLVRGARREVSRYRFQHVLFQQYLYDALGEGERRKRHGQVGQGLEELYGPGYPGAAVQLAHHYRQAGRSREAAQYALLAGDRARLVYAHQEAVAHYQAALSQLEELGDLEAQARALMKLGLTHQIAFEFPQAQRAFDRAFSIWKRQEHSLAPVRDRAAAPDERDAREQDIRQLRLLWRDPPSIDPTLGGYSMTAPVAMQLFSGLVAFGTESEILPDVAERWDIQDDGRRYVFHLRDDVVWSDGRPVTAYDFEFTYRRALDPETKALVAGQLLYAVRGARAFHLGEADDPAGIGIQAPDERTLVFELEEPAAYFIHNLAYYVMLPVPQHVVSTRPDDWTRPERIVSNGPFLLAVWERGEIMILERNPRYHGAFTGNLEQVRLLLNAKPENQSELYAAGAIDVALNWFVAGYKMESLQRQFPEEYEKRRQFSTLYYFIDPAGPPFDDRRVRQALAMAINREALAHVIKPRYAMPAYGGFVPPGMPGHVPDCCLPFDPVRARELLAQSGFPQGRNFPKTRLLSYPHWADATKFLQDSWREHLGVEFEAQVITSDLDLEKREQFIGVGGWLADYPDPDNFLRVDVGLTIPHWRHETYEDLLVQASKITDQSERLALYRQAELILAEEACLVPYIYNDFHLMLKPWVKRYPTAAVKNFGFWKDVIVEPPQAHED